MRTFTREESSPSILPKIILCCIAGTLILGLVIWLVGQQAASKEAELAYAQAQDACNQNNNTATCIQKINAALRIKEDTRFLELKLNTLYANNQVAEAKLLAKRLIELDGNNPHYHFTLYKFLYGESAIEEALVELEKALEHQPNNVEYQIAKATTLVNSNQRNKAIPIYEKLIKNDPKDFFAWHQYALSYANFNQIPKAIAILKKAAPHFPKSDDYFFVLAGFYDKSGQKEEAVKHYRHSLEIHPLKDSIAATRILALTGKRVPPELENLSSGEVSFTPQGNVMYVRAELNGQPGTFMVDTGASYCVILSNKTKKYGIQPTNMVLPFQTGNGVLQAPIAYGNLRLSKYDLPNSRFIIAPDFKHEGIDGIIGMNVLNNFQMSVDPIRQVITLKH